jgi:hypothetical protein
MYVARLCDVESYGLKLPENLFYARLRVYRDGNSNGRMKARRSLGFVSSFWIVNFI